MIDELDRIIIHMMRLDEQLGEESWKLIVNLSSFAVIFKAIKR